MSTCSRCGTQFSCAMKDADPAAPAEPCWCTFLPPALPVPSVAGASCWCPACLTQHIIDHPQTAANTPPDNSA
ncbi:MULTISPECIES: cysteine-rich CWC family protein [unclassified Duganella]|uniref:cysteine-rich CWC family protein n=1 Tax=unclassified Duganella TaxID=2636909 RepID=UPI000B7FCF18|nr:MULTISPECIES: cysteine-rich CWC family protein [unclassified Duganella]